MLLTSTSATESTNNTPGTKDVRLWIMVYRLGIRSRREWAQELQIKTGQEQSKCAFGAGQWRFASERPHIIDTASGRRFVILRGSKCDAHTHPTVDVSAAECGLCDRWGRVRRSVEWIPRLHQLASVRFGNYGPIFFESNFLDFTFFGGESCVRLPQVWSSHFIRWNNIIIVTEQKAVVVEVVYFE